MAVREVRVVTGSTCDRTNRDSARVVFYIIERRPRIASSQCTHLVKSLGPFRDVAVRESAVYFDFRLAVDHLLNRPDEFLLINSKDDLILAL